MTVRIVGARCLLCSLSDVVLNRELGKVAAVVEISFCHLRLWFKFAWEVWGDGKFDDRALC
jgi:hypothetical protein